MGRLTAIELAGDTCTLVRAALRGEALTISAVEVFDPSAFPDADAFAAALRQVRQTHKLPRRSRVVAWGVREGAAPADPGAAPLLRPLTRAGFRVDRVVSPCDALAALARVRQPRADGAVAWLAINRSNVAIVVVRPGAMLYAHAFGWDSSIGATGSQARLLQRYSLVAFLAPEVRRAIAEVASQGVRVDALVTCGHLPDLRSLTMPLIEELDLEVETLDSTDGLTVEAAIADRVAELVPAVRLACAGALARPARAIVARPVPGWSGRAMLRVAGLVVAAAGVGWAWYSRPRQPSAPPLVARATPATPVRPATPIPAQTNSPPPKPAAPAREAIPPAAANRMAPQVRPTQSHPARPAPPLVVPRHRADTPTVPARRPDLLPDPVPRITTILVSPNRKFAMVDGRVVGVGDRVGQRVVSRIEPQWVLFREPSGVQIRVGLGGRLVGVQRTGGSR